MEVDLIASVTQFGTAGLIAYMWLNERKSAAVREREIREAIDRLSEQRLHIDALVKLVADNTRALTAIETGQRALVDGMTALTARLVLNAEVEDADG
ncbi:MAG: hypothetical protein AAGD00_00435 [Planctomycetota bacterium]